MVLFLSGIFVGKLGGLVVLPEGQEGRDVGVEGFVRVDLAVGTVLAKVDLVLRDGRVEAAVRPCDLDGQERLVVSREGQAKAEHQGQDLRNELHRHLFDRST